MSGPTGLASNQILQHIGPGLADNTTATPTTASSNGTSGTPHGHRPIAAPLTIRHEIQIEPSFTVLSIPEGTFGFP